MQVAPEISFHHMSRSQWIEDYIDKRIAKLENLADDMIACRVALEQEQGHQHTGNPYRVRVEVTIPPKKDLVAEKTGTVGDPQVQLRPVIRRTFEAIERQLKKEQQKRRGDVKQHDSEPRGIVVELNPALDYGVLQDAAGTHYTFHRDAVLHGDYDRLTAGTEVRFEPDVENEEEWEEEEFRASTVQLLHKPVTPITDTE